MFDLDLTFLKTKSSAYTHSQVLSIQTQPLVLVAFFLCNLTKTKRQTMEHETTESRNNARLAIIELANMISVPMSLNAVVRLNVADAIWQGGANTPLSASQILARVLPSGAGDPDNLQRILRMLASYGVFAEHLNDADSSERKYSLTETGKTLATDSQGLSYAPYVLQHHQVIITNFFFFFEN